MSAKAEALLALCMQVLPIWGRQMSTSCRQSEAAVGEMLSAFGALAPQLSQASHQSTGIAYAMGREDSGDGLRSLAARCELLLQPLQQQGPAGRQAVEQALQAIRTTVAVVEEAVTPLPLDAHRVNECVEQMYIGLQYQDRLSQVMSLLRDDIMRLGQAIADDDMDVNAIAVEPWLARLESAYAMAEQHRDHVEGQAADGSHDPNNETLFF